MKSRWRWGAILAFCLWLSNISFSQHHGGILISPAIYEVELKKGKYHSNAIRVLNKTGGKASLKVYASDFTLKENGSSSFHPKGTLPFSCSTWLKINPTSFELNPAEGRLVRFTLKTPQDISGGFNGVIFIESMPEKASDARGRRILFKARLGVKIFAAIEGTLNRLAELQDLFIKQEVKDSILNYSLLFKNTGNVHIKPVGRLEIIDQEDKVVSTIKLNQHKNTVLRNGLRDFSGNIKLNLPYGVYKAVAYMDYGGKSIIAMEKFFEVIEKPIIEEFTAEISEKKDKVIFSIIMADMAEKKWPYQDINIINTRGELIAKILVLLSKRFNNKATFTAEWSEIPAAGSYYAEIKAEGELDPMIISYIKFTVEK